jgi:hypothetical protein
MQKRAELPLGGKALVLAVLLSLALMLGCRVKQEGSGGDKNVKIDTPVGGLHVTTDADVKDVGLAVYPGAQPKPKKGNDGNNANVNISTGLFGIRVVALEYQTGDSPAKVAEFYKKELSKYGDVLECPGKKGTVKFSFTLGDESDKDGKPGCDKDHPLEGAVELR